MKVCKKCGGIIEDETKSAYGLCFNCFRDYLLEKVENYYNELKKPVIYQEKKFKKWILFIKNLFKRK